MASRIEGRKNFWHVLAHFYLFLCLCGHRSFSLFHNTHELKDDLWGPFYSENNSHQIPPIVWLQHTNNLPGRPRMLDRQQTVSILACEGSFVVNDLCGGDGWWALIIKRAAKLASRGCNSTLLQQHISTLTWSDALPYAWTSNMNPISVDINVILRTKPKSPCYNQSSYRTFPSRHPTLFHHRFWQCSASELYSTTS